MNWTMFLPPLVAAFLAAFFTALWQYLGNEKFKGVVDRLAMIIWVKAKMFFPMVLLVFFLLSIPILFYFSELTLLNIIITYSIFLTIYALFAKFKRKDVSTVISCKLGDKESEKGSNGLIYVRYDDGDVIEEIFAGETVRRTNTSIRHFYIYFAIKERVNNNL